jgi:transcription elongation factor Elf1
MFKKLKITCNEATTICNKNQYGEATLFDKIKLNIHFLHCKICLLYTKQNITLTTFYKRYAQNCKEIKHCLSTEDKEALKKSIENKNT